MRLVEFKSHAMGVSTTLCSSRKYRKKAIFGQIRKELGEVFRRLARQKKA